MESLVSYAKGIQYHVARAIWVGLLNSTFPYNYRDITGKLQMMATTYVADINRNNAGYI